MKVKLTDDEWQTILTVLKSCPEIRLGAGRDCRRFPEAVLWMTRSGSQCATVAETLRQVKLGFQTL